MNLFAPELGDVTRCVTRDGLTFVRYYVAVVLLINRLERTQFFVALKLREIVRNIW